MSAEGKRRVLLRLALASVLLGACGGNTAGDGDVGDVEAVLESAASALETGDIDAFLVHWTDVGLQDVFFETKAVFASNTAYYVRAKQYSMDAPANTKVSGDTATSEAALFFRVVGSPRRFSVVKLEDGWKIDGAEVISTDPPGVTIIGLTIDGQGMELDPAAIEGGDIALRVTANDGQRHEVGVMSVPADLDPAEFFANPVDEPPEGQSLPEGLDFIGGVNPIKPGSEATVLFKGGLPPGRYILFCSVEEPSSGTPHAELGEFAEFTVPGR